MLKNLSITASCALADRCGLVAVVGAIGDFKMAECMVEVMRRSAGRAHASRGVRSAVGSLENTRVVVSVHMSVIAAGANTDVSVTLG